MLGYLRPDGRIGIRNHVAVIFTVECAHHVADTIARAVPGAEAWGFPGCYPDAHGFRTMVEACRHPNVAGTLVVSLGCEGTNYRRLAEEIGRSGKPVEWLGIQEFGGTLSTVERGADLVRGMLADAELAPRVPIGPPDLVIGVECGGSDATSGLAANPATGYAVDMLVDAGATVIFSELPELLGCHAFLQQRAAGAVRDRVMDGLDRARRLSVSLGEFAISPGNKTGGLTTIEEKSLGALAKAGTRPITGVIGVCERPAGPGLWLLDKVGDPDALRISHYEETDSDGLMSLIASGAHLIVFTTGRGSVIGSVVTPVIKVCGNPVTCRRMGDNIDCDASPIMTGEADVPDIGARIYEQVLAVAGGNQTRAERLGHREFHLPYKPARACDL